MTLYQRPLHHLLQHSRLHSILEPFFQAPHLRVSQLKVLRFCLLACRWPTSQRGMPLSLCCQSEFPSFSFSSEFFPTLSGWSSQNDRWLDSGFHCLVCFQYLRCFHPLWSALWSWNHSWGLISNHPFWSLLDFILQAAWICYSWTEIQVWGRFRILRHQYLWGYPLTGFEDLWESMSHCSDQSCSIAKHQLALLFNPYYWDHQSCPNSHQQAYYLLVPSSH